MPANDNKGTVVEQILQVWLTTLANSDLLDAKIVARLEELARQGKLGQAEALVKALQAGQE